MTTTKPPPPLEWHPWYRDKTFLLDWLDGSDPHCVIPVLQPLRLRYNLEPSALDQPLRQIRLTKHRAVGPAPYVGRPYCYAWNTAVDEYGRWISGEAHRQPLPAIQDDDGIWCRL